MGHLRAVSCQQDGEAPAPRAAVKGGPDIPALYSRQHLALQVVLLDDIVYKRLLPAALEPPPCRAGSRAFGISFHYSFYPFVSTVPLL